MTDTLTVSAEDARALSRIEELTGVPANEVLHFLVCGELEKRERLERGEAPEDLGQGWNPMAIAARRCRERDAREAAKTLKGRPGGKR